MKRNLFSALVCLALSLASLAYDDEAALLAAIARQPDDDTARVVYADWLEEHGESQRAEFIRLQIDLARLSERDPKYKTTKARAELLQSQYQEKWLPPTFLENFDLREDGYVVWERGFPEGLMLNGVRKVNSAAGRAAINSLPLLRSLTIQKGIRRDGNREPTLFPRTLVTNLQKLKRLKELEHLGFEGGILGSAGMQELGVLSLEKLRSFACSNNEYFAESALSALLSSRWIGQIRTLRLNHISLTDEGQRRIWSSQELNSLETLSLRRDTYNVVAPNASGENEKSLPNLKHLEISLEADATVQLTQSKKFGQLTSFSVFSRNGNHQEEGQRISNAIMAVPHRLTDVTIATINGMGTVHSPLSEALKAKIEDNRRKEPCFGLVESLR